MFKLKTSIKSINIMFHNILDFSVLSQNHQDFEKKITLFNIKDSVNEVVEIEKDKIRLKEIDLQVHYFDFKN